VPVNAKCGVHTNRSSSTPWPLGLRRRRPARAGGTHVSEAGKAQRGERCGSHFEVAPADTAQACVHHHGKIRTQRADARCAPCRALRAPLSEFAPGGGVRVYTCCLRPVNSEGCTTGVHVFYGAPARPCPPPPPLTAPQSRNWRSCTHANPRPRVRRAAPSAQTALRCTRPRASASRACPSSTAPGARPTTRSSARTWASR
jgi:hypothetical protein